MIEDSDLNPYFTLGQILQKHNVKKVNTIEESFVLAETEGAIVVVQNDQFDGHIVSSFCLLDTVAVSIL
jgi:hypothetical protein